MSGIKFCSVGVCVDAFVSGVCVIPARRCAGGGGQGCMGWLATAGMGVSFYMCMHVCEEAEEGIQ